MDTINISKDHKVASPFGYNGVFSNSKTNQPFKKQLIKPETNNNNINTSHIENKLQTNHNSNNLNTYTNYSQQAIVDNSKKKWFRG